MSDPIDDALSIIFDHPGPWSEEMRARMAKVINATLERVLVASEEHIARLNSEAFHSESHEAEFRLYDYAAGVLEFADHIQALKLTIPESNSTNAGERA